MIDYISGNPWAAWLIVAIVLLVAELCSGGFFILCFAIGAAFAAGISLIGNVYLQLVAFLVISIISICLVRPFALRCLHRSKPYRASNADAILGRSGVVSQEIPSGAYGRVAVDGDDWKACAIDHEMLPVGTVVTIVERDSVIVKVKKSK